MWKLTTDGAYSCTSAYKDQFTGTIRSNMNSIVWKIWASLKCKLFSWLIIQNRVWTANRLAQRGLTLWSLLQSCSRMGCASPLQLRYSTRICSSIKAWLGLNFIQPQDWVMFFSVRDSWSRVIHERGQSRRALSSLEILISYEI